MARVKWFTYLLNDEGQPVNGADISIYLANTTTPVTIYTSEGGASTISTAPQLTTNEDGYFEFFISDSSDVNGYGANQKFKIAFEKTGILSGYNDYISIFPGYIPVDLTSSDATIDKTISNLYGNRWEDHRLDTTHIIHGIDEVSVVSSDTVKNKLVSNNNAKKWEDHINEVYTDVPHGLDGADETSADTVKNKLVSNNQLKTLHDSISGSTFTEYVPSGSLALSGSLPSSGSGYYYYDVNHALNDSNPIVMLYNSDNDKVFQPLEIETIDINTTRILTNSQINFNIKVLI